VDTSERKRHDGEALAVAICPDCAAETEGWDLTHEPTCPLGRRSEATSREDARWFELHPDKGIRRRPVRPDEITMLRLFHGLPDDAEGTGHGQGAAHRRRAARQGVRRSDHHPPGRCPMSAYERLLDALNSHVVRSNGTKAQALCPAHDDTSPSLSITATEGQALVYCHAGCETVDVLAELELGMTDLFDTPRGVDYRYENGRTVHRTPDKRFSQHGTENPPELYRLSKVRAAVAAGRTVFVVEGEKDVHALETLGVTATCAPMGAGKWSKVDPSPLYGAAKVVIIADRDRAGAQHTSDVYVSLKDQVGKLEVKQARRGKDAADHIAADLGVDDFAPVDEPVGDDADPDSWSPVDLTPYLDGKITRPEPSVGLKRSDGLQLLYPGREHAVIGEMESAKSWFACGSCAEELTNGNPVLYIHFEEADPGDTIERLLALGVPKATIPARFTFVGPDQPATPEKLARLLARRQGQGTARP
jgi:5S rRNA maturation endonuclease (ribonuclease M5)